MPARPKIPNNRQGQGTSFVWTGPLIASPKPLPSLQQTSRGLVCLMSKVRLNCKSRWLFLLLSPDKASPLHSRGGHWPRCILYLFPCHPSRFIPCYSYKHRPTRLQASHPFLRHKMPTPKNDPNNQEHPTDLLYQNRSFSYGESQIIWT